MRERLVEEEDQRLLDERPAERDALLLAAGHLARLALEQVRDVERLGDALHARLDLGLGPVLELEPERDVVVRGHVRVERVVLEHHRHPPLVGRDVGDVLVAEEDPAAVEAIEARDHAQRRALAAARRAEERDERAVGDLEREVVDGLDVAVEARDVLEPERDVGHGRFVPLCGAPRLACGAHRLAGCCPCRKPARHSQHDKCRLGRHRVQSLLRLHREPCDVRGLDEVRQPGEDVIVGVRRLVRADVQRGVPDVDRP